jgi:hypothetical protein
MNKKFVYQVGNNKKVINLPVDRFVTSRFYLHISHLQILPYAQHKSRSVRFINKVKKGKIHPCTGTEALYKPYGP